MVATVPLKVSGPVVVMAAAAAGGRAAAAQRALCAGAREQRPCAAETDTERDAAGSKYCSTKPSSVLHARAHPSQGLSKAFMGTGGRESGEEALQAQELKGTPYFLQAVCL